MKKILFCLAFLFISPLLVMSQSGSGQINYLTSQPWKVELVEVKTFNTNKYQALSVQDDKTCIRKATILFKSDGSLQMQTKRPPCDYNALGGKWKSLEGFSKLQIKTDIDEEPVVYEVYQINGNQMVLEQTFFDEKGVKVWKKTSFTPLNNKNIYLSQLQQIINLNSSNYSEKVTSMGFTQVRLNNEDAYISFSKNGEGKLKIHKEENGKFKRIEYRFNSPIPMSFISDFSNDYTIYSIESVQRKYSGSDEWKRTDKHYKDGFVFEANQNSQTFSVYKPTEEDIQKLTAKYPKQAFPELGIVKQKPTAQPTPERTPQVTPQIKKTGNFCSELKYILQTMENREYDKLVDKTRPMDFTRSWFEAKLPLSGYVNLKGQNMMGYLSFSARMDGSDIEDNEKLYLKLVADVENCIGNNFRKEMKEKVTYFTKKNSRFLLKVEYFGGKGNHIYISIQNP